MQQWLQANILSNEGAAWLRYASLMITVVWGFWRGLPAVFDMFERRQSGIEIRTEALLDAQSRRFAEQLAAADDRHEECMKGQQVMREQMEDLQRKNNELWSLLNAMRQGAASVENVVARTIKEARDDCPT